MGNQTGSLERYYNTAVQSKKDWGFFLGVADYFELIEELPELKPLIDKIFTERDKALEEIHKIEPEAVKELQDFKKELLATIKKGRIKKEGLQKAIEELNDLESGKLKPHNYQSSRLDEGLKNLVRLLSDDEEDFKKNYGHSGISKKHLTRQALSLKLSGEKEKTIWGAYINIRNVFRVIKEYYEHLDNLKKEKSDTETFLKLKKEIDIIEKNGDETGFSFLYSARSSEDYFSSSKDKRIRELQRDKYEIYLTRFHNYLVKELSRDEKAEGLQHLNNLQMSKFYTAQQNVEHSEIVEEITRDLPNKEFHTNKVAGEKMAKQFLEKAEFAKEIKNSILEEMNGAKGGKKTGKSAKRLITRDAIAGEFYYKNKPINFQGNETIYFLIFECLYEKSDFNGFCSYETINNYLQASGEEEYDDDRQIKDRIKNGIANLFRFTGLPKKNPTGKKLIDVSRGKGLIFNNPSS
ncbi:MAG: hypothetical protein EXS52_00755 [Candidatus Staskawiczbacteria bacterium]|nr:hypothetical protein [Candidatus Staskawiczbacteria bacterium]